MGEGGSAVAIGAIVTIITGFGVIAKIMLNQASKDRDADREERKELVMAIKDMAGATGRVADATKQGADEAKQRNGHLAELIIRSKKDTEVLANKAVEKISAKIDSQTIKEQNVIHQHVKDKDKEE